VADNIRSSLSLYSMQCTILNWQFHLNYLVLPVSNVTEGEDESEMKNFGIVQVDSYSEMGGELGIWHFVPL